MPDFATEKERHEYILTRAEYFTTVLFKGRGEYQRAEYPTQEKAEEGARALAKATGKRTMVYAVAGNSDTLVKVI